MTQEDKQLLLKDLCARLPYGVTYYHDTKNVVTPKQILGLTEINNILLGIGDNIKPYLRPMSSMTNEEKSEFSEYVFESNEIGDITTLDAGDWLDANHFDYRGLIEKGLALEAPENMYKTE